MKVTPFTAIGAGMASALLFVVSAKGTTAALLVCLTALPIMIAGLGFGHLSGLVGALIGAGTITVTLGPVFGGFFALCFALPAWWLSYLALLARPAETMPSLPAGAASAVTWYPIGRLVAWAAASASLAVVAIGLVIVTRFGSYDAAMQALSRHFAILLTYPARQANVDASELAGLVVRLLPPTIAAMTAAMLLVNLWLGGRISEVSQRLTRPWPNVPDGFSLPRPAAAVVLLGLLPLVTDGAVASAGATVAAAFGMAFALQGLAAAHVLTRGFRGRGMILTTIYLVTVVAMPWPLVALTLLGLVDCLFSLRFRRPPTSTPKTTAGEQPWK